MASNTFTPNDCSQLRSVISCYHKGNNANHPPIAPASRELLVRFMRSFPDVTQYRHWEIKQFTKIADAAATREPPFDAFLERRLFDYNNQGAALARTKGDTRMAAHFHSYAGKTASRLYNKVDDLEWQRRAYDSHLEAATLAGADEIDFVASRYADAGSAALDISLISSEPVWTERVQSCLEECADRVEQGARGARDLYNTLRTRISFLSQLNRSA